MEWEPLSVYYPGIWVLRIEHTEVARVNQRVDGRGWLSQVNRHQRDHGRRLWVLAPSERAAKRWAERWTRANLPHILDELPGLTKGPAGINIAVYPACNPDPRSVS